MPIAALAFNYWLHLVATIVWLGGLATLVLVAWPGMARALADHPSAAELFDVLERRFRPLANVSLIVLIVTGMLQMGGDPHYEGFLRVESAWSISLLAKHVIILAMIGVSAALQWSVRPALERARFEAQHSTRAGTALEDGLRRRMRRLTAANLILGLLVLLVTALLTAL